MPSFHAIYKPDGSDRLGRIGVDAPRVSRDMALELMVHHLQLAAMYYEATSADEAANLAEAERLMQSEIPDHDEPARIAMRPWLAALNNYYASLKKKQGD